MQEFDELDIYSSTMLPKKVENCDLETTDAHNSSNEEKKCSENSYEENNTSNEMGPENKLFEVISRNQSLEGKVNELTYIIEVQKKKQLEQEKKIQLLETENRRLKEENEKSFKDFSVIEKRVEDNDESILRQVHDLQMQPDRIVQLETQITKKNEQITQLLNSLGEYRKLVEKKEKIIQSIKTKDESIKYVEKEITIGDLLDLVGKFMDKLNPKKMVRVKNALTIYAEQKLTAKVD